MPTVTDRVTSDSMAADDPVTLGELGRRVQALEQSNKERFIDFERRMEQGFARVTQTIANQANVHIDRYDADQRRIDDRFKALEHRQNDTEGNQKWTMRALAGGIVSIVVGLVLAYYAARGAG